MNNPFDRDQLLDAAAAQVPGTDFGPGDFKPSLDLFLATLRDEARLTPMGTWSAVGRVVQALKRRRLLAALLEERPDIPELPLDSPVFIVGFPRTGSTMLHNLLASNPSHRAVRLWEMREPFAPRGAEADWKDSTVAMTQQLVQAGYQLAPRLADIHPLKAEWPDECSWLFRNSFATLVNAFANYIPTYRDYVMARDMREDYRVYRLQLQAILAQRPGQPLVLKDPCHSWHLDALLEAFPDARIIHLHRSLPSVIGSFASLCHALQEGSSEVRSQAEIGAYATEMLLGGMDAMLKARKAHPDAQFIDVAYHDLVADPMATVAALHEQLGLAYDEDARAAVQAWLDGSKKLTGKHSYSLDDYGIGEDTLARFAPYEDRFAAFLPSNR